MSDVPGLKTAALRQLGNLKNGQGAYMLEAMISVEGNKCEWLSTGDAVFPAMLAAINAAQKSVRLEFYTYTSGPLGKQFLDAMVQARERGVSVHVMVDGAGSYTLTSSFWEPLRKAGGEVRIFNPLAFKRFGIRNHRKLLVCDDAVAFIGGFNIEDCYDGDGVTKGWRDLGMRIEGPLVVQLVSTFDEMFPRAEFRHKFLERFLKSKAKRTIKTNVAKILLSGPGWGKSPFKEALKEDLLKASRVQIAVAYFLPTWRLRHALGNVARRGGALELILPGKSDVWLSQTAARSLYRKFLTAGVRIFEYQPQTMHAKLIVIDDVVYLGSSNLDQRSLAINYELMIRFENKEMAAQAREIMAGLGEHSTEIKLAEWRKGRTIWRRIKQRFAYWTLMRLDVWVARRQWRSLPD